MINTEKFTDDQKQTLENYTDLIHLSLNKINLKSLENFPQLKSVQIVSNIIFIYFR